MINPVKEFASMKELASFPDSQSGESNQLIAVRRRTHIWYCTN